MPPSANRLVQRGLEIRTVNVAAEVLLTVVRSADATDRRPDAELK